MATMNSRGTAQVDLPTISTASQSQPTCKLGSLNNLNNEPRDDCGVNDQHNNLHFYEPSKLGGSLPLECGGGSGIEELMR